MYEVRFVIDNRVGFLGITGVHLLEWYTCSHGLDRLQVLASAQFMCLRRRRFRRRVVQSLKAIAQKPAFRRRRFDEREHLRLRESPTDCALDEKRGSTSIWIQLLRGGDTGLKVNPDRC